MYEVTKDDSVTHTFQQLGTIQENGHENVLCYTDILQVFLMESKDMDFVLQSGQAGGENRCATYREGSWPICFNCLRVYKQTS